VAGVVYLITRSQFVRGADRRKSEKKRTRDDIMESTAVVTALVMIVVS
jgi:hypothetical protein